MAVAILQYIEHFGTLTYNNLLDLTDFVPVLCVINKLHITVKYVYFQNKTSWVLYNMAAFYWRIKGDPYHVIECARRALHFSPKYVHMNP